MVKELLIDHNGRELYLVGKVYYGTRLDPEDRGDITGFKVFDELTSEDITDELSWDERDKLEQILFDQGK